MPKTQKSQKTLHRLDFFDKIAKERKWKYLLFCPITFEPIKIDTCLAPQNDCLNLSFVKNGRKSAICNSPFLCIRV